MLLALLCLQRHFGANIAMTVCMLLILLAALLKQLDRPTQRSRRPSAEMDSVHSSEEFSNIVGSRQEHLHSNVDRGRVQRMSLG